MKGKFQKSKMKMQRGRKLKDNREYQGNRRLNRAEAGNEIIKQVSAVGNRKCVNVCERDKWTKRGSDGVKILDSVGLCVFIRARVSISKTVKRRVTNTWYTSSIKDQFC